MLGVVTVDPVLTVLALAFWFGVVRDVLVELSPDAVRSRLVPHVRWTARQWLLAPVAAAIGALTHVLWDTFTHPDRWGSEHIGWLHEEHAGLRGSAWLQYLSGVVGLAIVCWAIWAHLRSLPPIRTPRPQSRWAPAAVAVVVLAGAVAGLAAAVASAPALHAMAFNGVVDGIIAVVVSTTVVCVAWRVAGPSPG